MKAASVLRTASGLLVFFAAWALAALAGYRLGDYWIWLGALFGWVPAVVLANLAERAWVWLLVALAAAAWFCLPR